jgi:hypothetical protein
MVQIPDFHAVTPVFSKSKRAARWAIELFFKDCKQLLHFGREQNQDLDAILAHHNLAFICCTPLAHILRVKGICSVVGTLFEKIADHILKRNYARRVMDCFKLLVFLSIEMLSLEIPREKVLQLFQLIDYLIESKLQMPPKIMRET